MITNYRINYFTQIKNFYSFVFNSDKEVRPVHISLYMFLLNQNNRNNWIEWFKCPYDLAMQGACVSSKNTYYKALDDLQSFNLIEYQKGINLYKSPKIKILPLIIDNSVLNIDTLTEQLSVPLSEKLTEPLTAPQTEPLSVLLNKNIYKLITNNLKLINDNKEKVISFLSDLNITHSSQKFSFLNSLIDYGFEEKLVKDFLIVRKNKKATNSETSFKNLIKQFEITIEEFKIDKNELLEFVVSKDWKSFQHDWFVAKKNEFKNNLTNKTNGTTNTTQPAKRQATFSFANVEKSLLAASERRRIKLEE